MSKRTLLAEVWQQAYGGGDRTVDVHLSWLRRKLGETAAEPRFLHTVRGVGHPPRGRGRDPTRDPVVTAVRRRVSVLVAATTSAVVLAFVVPLCLLIQAWPRTGPGHADQEARNIAIIVSSLQGQDSLPGVVRALDQRLPRGPRWCSRTARIDPSGTGGDAPTTPS